MGRRDVAIVGGRRDKGTISGREQGGCLRKEKTVDLTNYVPMTYLE